MELCSCVLRSFHIKLYHQIPVLGLLYDRSIDTKRAARPETLYVTQHHQMRHKSHTKVLR